MERIYKDLKTLKILEIIFLVVFFIFIGAFSWIGSRASMLPIILQHVDSVVLHMDIAKGVGG